MKTNLLLSVVLLLSAASCHKKPVETAQQPAAPAAETPKRGKPGWEYIPPPPPEPPRKPQTMTIIDKIPFGSAHSTPEDIQGFVRSVEASNSGDAVRWRPGERPKA